MVQSHFPEPELFLSEVVDELDHEVNSNILPNEVAAKLAEYFKAVSDGAKRYKSTDRAHLIISGRGNLGKTYLVH